MKANDTSGIAGWNPRPVHRILGSILLLFTLYLAVTGSMMQFVDLRAILSHAPGTDKEMMQIREGINGPASFVVIQPTDYDATSLPAGFDYRTALANVLRGAHAAAGDSPFKFVDLRVAGGKPIGVVRAGEETVRLDAATGAKLPDAPRRPAEQEKSVHLTFKVLHVLRGTSNWITLLHTIVGLGLFTITVSGLVLYFRLLRARNRAGLQGFFWSSGGTWRSLHRGISIVAAVFLLVISLSGTMLAIDGLGSGFYRATHKNAGKYKQFSLGAVGDLSSPLPDTKLPAMLRTTLSAAQDLPGASPIKAVRLRYFSGIPQGVLIVGNGSDTQQLVFNADTGKRMSMTEPEYPKTHYYLGWHEHEIMKQIHRGDAFGVTGRMMDLFAGLSLIYLSISGGVMYADLWRKRRRAGRAAFFWT